MIFLKLLQPLGSDFVVYFEAAKVFLAGGNPYLGLITRTFPFNYPPPALLFLWPLALFDFATANIIWNLLSLAAVIISIALIGQIMGIGKRSFLLACFLFTIFFFPVKFNIGNGQINHFLLLFCSASLYLYFQNRKTLSALFLASAITIKLAPVIFLLFFIIRRDWHQTLRILAITLILFGVSLVLWPQNNLIYWHDVLPLSFTEAVKDWYYNQSLWGFLARFISSNLSSYLFYLLSMLILFLTWWQGRQLNARRLLAAISCLYLLIHPIALQHYFGFAITPLILLWDKRDWKILFASYFLLAFDIKNFASVPKEFSLLLSHDFYAVLSLWILALWRQKFWTILTVLWSGTILLSYLLMLLCRAKFCF